MSITVREAVFTETGTYNDMPLRPYRTQSNGGVIQQFQENTEFGEMISPDTLSSVASSFIRPDSEIHGYAQIDNGWGNRRCRFALTLEHRNMQGTVTSLQVLTGYTDHPGVNLAGSDVDPNMRLYFNNSVTQRLTHEEVNGVRRPMLRNTDAVHVLTADFTPAFDQSDNNYYTMCPEDVFTTMGRMEMGNMVQDERASFGGCGVKLSRRQNNSTPHYVSDLLNTYQTLSSDPSLPASNFSGMMKKAKGTVEEPTFSKTAFFSELGRLQTSFTEGGSITYREMCELDPNFDRIAEFYMNQGVQQNNGGARLHMRGETAEWDGRAGAQETTAATVINNSLPSIMMELMLKRVAFTATNRTIDGRFEIRVADARAFGDVDPGPYMNAFLRRLEVEVLRIVSSNNNLDCWVEVVADVVGENHINVSLDGYPAIPFVCPTFCDARISPVLADSRSLLEEVSYDASILMDNLGVSHGEPTSFDDFGGMNNGKPASII